jgi:hypothetical protein
MEHRLWAMDDRELLDNRVVQRILALFGPPVLMQFIATNGADLVILFAKMLRHLSSKQTNAVRSCVAWCDLPHRVSTRAEIESMIQTMMASFKTVPHFHPIIVTVACSATDGFLPVRDVKWIVATLMKALRRYLGDIQILPESDTAHYLS